MSYNTELQSNNIDLQRILDMVNALPEAGSSGETIEPVINSLSITKNGTYTAPSGVDGYSPVTVNVPIPDGYLKPSGTLNITQNGEYDVTEKAGVVVSVDSSEPTLQEKTVTPATSSQAITPDSGYDGLSKVTVNAMPTATQATPSITVSSAGLITASATQSAGYVSAGTKSATKQLTTQAAKTITPSKSAQTAVASGRYTTGAVKVAAIPSQYITTTDATAAAADLRTGKTAYVNGSKVTGTIQDFDGSYECDENSSGSGSGGGSSETCTVAIIINYSNLIWGGEGSIYAVYQSKNGNTVLENTVTLDTRTLTVTLVDCVCNSLITITGEWLDLLPGASTAIVEGTASLIVASPGCTYVFSAPTVANENCTITLED